nr:MAG TPA: minor tail protein [Caudoviricetes sp.]
MALFKVKAVPDFTQLRSELTKLSSTPVKIKVDATDFNALSNQAIKTMNATARLTKAQNELAVAQEKTKQTANQLAAAQQKTTQTANQLATQMERTATAEEKARKANLDLSREIQKATTEQEKQKTAAAQAALQQEKAATASANLAVQQEKTATAAAKAAGNITKVGQSAKETSGFAGMMGDSLANVVGKMAAWQLLGSAISGAVNAFKDALDTMKSVDDEMVTIRKVTGATTEELQKIEAQAYKTASAYGVAADEYLNSVSAFSRAGYGDQASALAELATKTQIVGDTDAKTAQQFLLSVDAAYKYQGSIESLSRVLDGANEIDNKYATSIEKIAEGLGKVAPIASQAHVGVDELTAAIGTITAVTQRSGTEAATALRALFLNIIGDTKTEIDEGVTWTTGEIAGLRDLIKVYAKDAYDLAQATGEVINPMKAIEGLSKSMKDGLLSEQELMEMVSDIGGKLRTSQLLALIQNWDMYQSMLGDYANSIGSADKEVENALDSWSRKTEILKNQWTEFIGHMVETDTIKSALDGLIGLVEFLDSDMGKLVITAGLLAAASAGIGSAWSSLAQTPLVGTIKTLTMELLAYAVAQKAAAAGDGEMALQAAQLKESLSASLGKLKALGIGTAIFAALALAIHVSTQRTREYEAALNDVEKAQSALSDTDSEYEDLISRTDTLTDAEKKRLEVLKDIRAEEEKALEAAKKATWEKWNNLHGTGAQTVIGGATGVGGGLGSGAIQTEPMDVAALREYNDELARIEEIYQNGQMAAGEYYKALQDLNSAREEDISTIRAAIDAGYDVSQQQRDLVARYDEVQQKLGATTSATSTYVNSLISEAQQAGQTGQAMYDYAASLITASNTTLNVSQQMSALQALAVQAGYTAQAIAQVMGFSDTAATNQIRAAANGLMRSGQAKTSEEAMAMAKANYMNGLWGSLTTNYTPNTPSASYPSSGGGYSGGSSSGRGYSSSGSSDAARKRAQNAIKQLQKDRDAELDVIQEQIDALQEQAEIEDRQAKIEEYKLEILKKQDAVMNARNERTVRQYNASTGQWEWVADATKVKKAEEDLENAKKDLREYERKVEIDLAVEELKTRQEAIKAAYQIKIDAWQDYLSGLASAISDEAQYLNQSVANNQAAAEAVRKAWEAAIAARDEAGDSSGGSTEKPGVESPGGGDDTVYAPSTASKLDIQTMQAYLGVTPDGIWGTKSAAALKNSRFSSFDEMLRYFYSDGGPLDKAVAAVKAGNEQAVRQYGAMKQSGYGDQISYASVANTMKYDAGGILKGMGGIKATSQDEIVLPPKLAAKMLTPLADRTFKARLGELGFLYGAENNLPRTLTGSTDNRSYTDNSGTRYQIGSIVMTEQQAKRTTIYDAAQQAHNLQAFSG